MECSCNAGYGGDWDSGCYSGNREVKAAKPHKCYECGCEIKKGDKYQYWTVFCEGTIDNFKLCSDCNVIAKTFFRDGWMFGSVIDDLGDYLYGSWKTDLPSNCISKLPPGARDRVCDILQEWQEPA